MKVRISLIIALLLFSISNIFAHAVWIETASAGKKGQAQQVKVFFGEYSEKDISATKKWFSNLRDFTLELTSPDGKKTTLKTVADSLFFKADFTPTQEGTYVVSVVHIVKDLYQNAKLQYYAFANVNIGNGKVNTAFPVDANLVIKPSKAVVKLNETVAHQLIYNKAPLAKEKITVIAPELNKTEVETDSEGKFAFNPKQKGGYFLEAFKEENTPGTFDGKPYEKVWHVITYFTTIQ